MKTSEMQVVMLDCMGDDLSVVNAARVSFEKRSEWEYNEAGLDWYLSVKDAKLISYLAKHKHTSPFNHCFASFKVKAPIFVARQLVKHKFLPWNEVSRRYVDSEPEFYIPDSWRARAENVKQGSSGDTVVMMCHYDQVTGEPWEVEINNSMYLYTESCLSMYSDLLDAGVCPEQARMVLPQNTMTEWVWSGSLGAWADMLRLRLDPHAQKETREVAEKIRDELKIAFPVSIKALLEVQ